MKTKTMNTYNIFENGNESTILYHSIAEDEQQVRELAEEKGIILNNMTIELERTDVRNQLGKSYAAVIEDALVH